MRKPQELSRRELLTWTGVTTFAIPFTNALVEMRTSAADILSRPKIIEDPLPVISVIADGGMSQRDSFDAKESPKSMYDSGIPSYAPSTGSDLIFTNLFTRIGSLVDKLAICRTISSQGAGGVHAIDSKVLLQDGNGRNWHELLAKHTQKNTPHPYYYIPAPNYDIGIETNTQGAGLRVENSPFHSISQSFAFDPSGENAVHSSTNTALLTSRYHLLKAMESKCVIGGAVREYQEHQRFALRLLCRQSTDLVQSPSPNVLKRYGTYGLPFYYAGELVRNGARSVAVRTGSWDFHYGLIESMNAYAPQLDQAVSSLIEDIASGELPPSVVSFCSEFGRTPSFLFRNGEPPGRDHFGTTTSLLYGGKSNAGVYGVTDADSRPLSNKYDIKSSNWRYAVFKAAGYPELIPDDVKLPAELFS